MNYIFFWRGLLFITHSWAVQSLNLVIAIVPTLLYFVIVNMGTLATILENKTESISTNLISVQLLVVFLTLIQNLFTNGYLLGT